MRLLFRPDLSPDIGTGHLMRCWALAQACLAQGCEALFALHQCPDSLLARIGGPGIATTDLGLPSDAAELAKVATRFRADAIVLDGYSLDSRYRLAIAGLGLPVVAIDDGNLSFALHADIVLNSAPLACPEDYALTAPGARLLLGPAFAPLRREFLEPEPIGDRAVASDRVLLTFGGSDPAGLTHPMALSLLDLLPAEAQLDIVLGAAHTDPGPVEQLASGRPGRITLHRNSGYMAALMAGARLAVSAAGSTLWELASLGVPTIGVVVADNQSDRLVPPERDWFLSLDARTELDLALQRITSSALALWQDAAKRQAQSARLKSIGVGRRLPDVCSAIRGMIEDQT